MKHFPRFFRFCSAIKFSYYAKRHKKQPCPLKSPPINLLIPFLSHSPVSIVTNTLLLLSILIIILTIDYTPLFFDIKTVTISCFSFLISFHFFAATFKEDFLFPFSKFLIRLFWNLFL